MSESELAVLLLTPKPNPDAWDQDWHTLGDRTPGMSAQSDGRRVEFLQSLRQQGSVQRAVEELSLEEKTIVKLRYGVLQDDELTLSAIGESLGLSRERVRLMEWRAEGKCRRSVKRH